MMGVAMRRFAFILALLVAVPALAQISVVDLGPGATDCGSVCTAGWFCFDTNAAKGARALLCTAADTWTAIDEDGVAGAGDITDMGDCSTGACFTAAGTGTAQIFKNATSGQITLQTVAGALGTRVISMPAETGTVCTTGSVCSGYQAGPLSGDVVTVGAAATIQANSVALGTDTTGNYAGSASEGGAATTALALDANGANCSAGSYPLGVDAAGAVESCTTIAAGAASALLDATVHTDTTASAVTRGDLVYGNSTPAWDDLALGNRGEYLASDGTDLGWTHQRQYTRQMQTLKTAGGSTLEQVGYSSTITTTGASVANADGADGPWVSYVTGTTSGNSGGATSVYTLMRRDWTIDFVARVQLGALVTSVRYWVGMFSATPVASATPAIHLAAFRYDTTADGTAFWVCATDDGGAAPTTTTTANAISAGGVYTLRVRADSTDVRFFIDGVLVATHTTNLPTATQLMGWSHHVTTLSNAARTLQFGRNAIEYR